MNARRFGICLTLVLATGVARHVMADSRPPSVDLSRLPIAIGAWRGAEAPPLDETVVTLLAADSYVNRTYVAESDTPIGLYVAYYAGQTPGDSMHSPLNCLPGTGWEPVATSTLSLARPDGTRGAVRRMLVRKENEQALVLYWYQVHGRMLANEWDSKLYLLVDSVRLHRSDAALVRIVAPIDGSVQAADREALAFTQALLPSVNRLWSER